MAGPTGTSGPPTPERKLAASVARRREAAVAGHTGDVARARELLADGDGGVRATALRALARAGAVDAPDVSRAAVDPDPVVRVAATEVIATGVGRAALAGLLADHEATVTESAAWAAGEAQPADPVVVATLARLAGGHDDPLVREAAVAALGALGDPAGLSAVLAATTDKPAVRRRAVLALAPFEGPEVDAALERARADRDRQVRQAAEDLLAP